MAIAVKSIREDVWGSSRATFGILTSDGTGSATFDSGLTTIESIVIQGADPAVVVTYTAKGIVTVTPAVTGDMTFIAVGS